ncbi:hypothetical protein [Methanolapillus millepedarum]|uniref:Uncharacterized protein n=1 Tax=Methanolapillus millepedarum TaxID=3028296 RepID=A0AA96V4L4_9EURY|nr:hypothetical protein MsAc7_04320 [Methanosarcinaceae archaeon Ac7]
MNQEIFEFATINAIATLPESSNSTLKEFTASVFVETHSIEQIEKLITKLKVFNLFETIAHPNNESSKWLNLFIDLIRQKVNEKSIRID